MKILILCRPRTRSTLLIDSVAKHFEITDEDENLKRTYGKFHSILLNPKFYDTFFNEFQKSFKNHVQELFVKNNFVVKLYPRMLTFSPHVINNIKEYNLTCMSNLTYFANIRKFDKIYYLDRNIVDSVCSWAFSNHINNFNFRNERNLADYQSINISIDIEKDAFLKFYIFEACILKLYKTFLEKNNINFIDLTYDNVVDYTKLNFPNVVNKTIHSNFDYSKIITNYYDLQTSIMSYYDECDQYLKDLLVCD